MNEKMAAIRRRPIKSICQKKSDQRWADIRDLTGEGRFARAPDRLARTSADMRVMKRGIAITGKIIPNIPSCQRSSSRGPEDRVGEVREGQDVGMKGPR